MEKINYTYCVVCGKKDNIRITALIFLIMIFGCSSAKYAGLGVKNGKLLPCPDTPNCVSSQSIEKKHSIDPICWTENTLEVKQILFDTIHSMKRARVVSHDTNYVHAEFTTAIFRFVDDVEFLIDKSKKIIHVRSASRVGYSDLGVNRRRVEKIRRIFHERIKEKLCE